MSADRRLRRVSGRVALSSIGLALVAVVLTAGGCGLLDPDDDGPLDRLRRQRSLWMAQSHTDYHYVLRRGCFCTPETVGPVEVEVQGGQVVALTYVETGDAVSNWTELWPTIPGLFDLLERALDGEADDVQIEYHPTLHYPVTADIDYIEEAIDDELYLAVLSFTPGS